MLPKNMQMKLLTPDNSNWKTRKQNKKTPKPQTTRKEETDAALKNYSINLHWIQLDIA